MHRICTDAQSMAVVGAVTHVRVGNVPVACIGMAGLLQTMANDAVRFRAGDLRMPRLVLDTNGQALSMAARDPAYRAALEQADVVHADGEFIVRVARLKGGAQVPERTATTDFLPAAAALAEREGLRFYLLGSTPEVNAACVRELRARHPALQIVGHRDGFFAPEDEAAVIEAINATRPDVVWIGLGKPREQMFALRARDRTQAAWLVTCGGCFHFIAGDYTRAPNWMQRAGLEWLHRMATGPRYLIGRYLTTIPHALALVVRHDILTRRGGRA